MHPGVDSVYGAGELQLPKPPDLVAPTALASTARRGRGQAPVSRLGRFGQVALVEEIKLRGKVVARPKQVWFLSTSHMRTVAVAWKVPVDAQGTYRHCVRAVDRAGNKAPVSCARIVLR